MRCIDGLNVACLCLQVIALNDAMVALVAPLGGVGPGNPGERAAQLRPMRQVPSMRHFLGIGGSGC